MTSATRTTTTTSSLLDVVVANIGSSRIAHTTVQPTHHVSDHELVTWSWANRLRPPRRVMTYLSRNLKSVDWMQFSDDIRRSQLFTSPAEGANEFADQLQLDNTVVEILDCHCPLQVRRKFASNRRDSRWLSAGAVEAKRARRQLERKWKTTRSEVDYTAYRKACRSANKLIIGSPE